VDAPTSTPDLWPEALAHIREAHRRGGRVNYIGGPADSITDGFGATSRANGWWSRFARQMATALGQPTRAIGSAEITPDSTWPVWTTTGPRPKVSGRGLGRHGMALHLGTVASTVQACDRFRLLYDETTESFGLHGGTLEIRIDGELAAVLDCAHDDVVGRMWDSGPLGRFAPRRFELECVGGDFVGVGHSYFHDGADGETGALFWRNAHARYEAGCGHFGFGQAESTWTGPLTSRVIGRNPFNQQAVRGGGAIAPDCFLCCTGTNDIGRLANDRETIASIYESLITYIRSRCGEQCSIGFIVPTATERTYVDHQALFEGTRDACEASGAFLIDLWHPLGSHADHGAGFYFDGMHPNDRGHAAWANYVTNWMLAAIQPGSSGG
jgi:hypothetical protein